jgi:hypothetical protein
MTYLISLEIDSFHRLANFFLCSLALLQRPVHLFECDARLADCLGPVKSLRLGDSGLVHLARFGQSGPSPRTQGRSQIGPRMAVGL